MSSPVRVCIAPAAYRRFTIRAVLRPGPPFVGLSIEQAVWDYSLFSMNRDRLLGHEAVEALATELLRSWVGLRNEVCSRKNRGTMKTEAARDPSLEVFRAPPSAALPSSERLIAAISASRSDQL
jgi:hypothetical protein